MSPPLPGFSVDNQQRLHSLLTIQRTAESIKARIQPRLSKGLPTVIPSVCANVSVPVLDLPFPSDLDTNLKTLGLSERICGEVTLKIQEWVHSLQTIHTLNFRHACHDLASLPHFQNRSVLNSAIEQMRLAYERRYVSNLPQITQYILAAQSKQSSINKDAKTPFKNEYTPFLELYFEQNAYPSLPDRQFLARKSMMSMRQIDVWFQNHRARAKKEGRTIKKPNSSFQPQLNLGSLKEHMPFLPTTDSAMKASVDKELRDDESSEDEASTTPPPFIPCSFTQVAPPHAFPTTYPPNLTTDPFPNENGHFRFPPPIWMRTPTQSKCPTAVPDMDEFISTFSSKLHLRDRSRRKCNDQHPRNAKGHKKPWFAPTVVVPAPAPHPALIRSPYIYSSPIPVSPSSNARKARKFAPFSKRAPSALSTNHSSERPDAFFPFASRTCSFRSAASSQSRSSSSSSSASSAEPVTPPLSPTQQEQNPLLADHGYQLLDELFGPEPSQLFNSMAYDNPDFLFPTILQKEIPHNPLYDLSSMFPPALAQVHC